MKKTAGILLIAAGVCAAAAYWVDLMNFTDLSKGFAATSTRDIAVASATDDPPNLSTRNPISFP